jgi:hypothetical protein
MRGLIRHIPEGNPDDEDCAAVGAEDEPDEPDDWRDYADEEDLNPGEPAFIEAEELNE